MAYTKKTNTIKTEEIVSNTKNKTESDKRKLKSFSLVT